MIQDFNSPLRQSPWAILFILWHYGRIMVRQLWPLFLIIFVQPAKNQNGYGLYLILGILVIMLISAVINHFFFSFRVDEDTFYIKEGWLRKKNKTIPIDRIQSLNVEQTLLHRITDTGKVLVETAGSAKAEVEIRAIGMDIVAELQTKLFKRAAYPTKATKHDVKEEVETPLFTLGFLDLVKVGLSQNHLRTIGVVLAVVIGFLDDLENQWDILPEGKLEEMGEAVQSMMVLVTLGTILTVGVIIASVVRILLSHADLALYVQGQRFRLNAGLLTIRETVVTKRKLQSLTWSENPIQRMFGMFHLNFSQATVDSPEGRQQVSIPGLYQNQLQSILGLVFPTEQRGQGAWAGINHRYFWKRWVVSGIIPAVSIALAGYFLDFSLWLPALIWGLTSAFFAWKVTKRWQWFINRDILILKRGWLTPETTLLPIYKIQSLSLHQTPVQRWHHLYSVTLHTAAGTEVIPYLLQDQAEQLQRYVLFRIESDGRSWM